MISKEHLLGFVVPLAILPGLADLANGPKFAVLGLGLALLVQRLKLTLAAWLLLGWLGVTAAGLIWTPTPWAALREFWFLALFAMAFAIGQNGDSDAILEGAAWGTLPSIALALAERAWGWGLVPEAYPPSGFFSNKNFLGEASALLGLWALLGRRWMLGLALCFGVVVTEYRAGGLALALAGLYWVWLRERNIAVALAICLGALAWASVSAHSLGLRWIIWEQTLGEMTWLGRGPGSFAQLFPSYNTTYDLLIDRPEHPHNEAINLAFTLGLFVAFPVGLYATLYLTAARTERYILIAALAPLGFSFPLGLPVSLLVLGLVAGRADRSSGSVGPWLVERGSALYDVLAAWLRRANLWGAKAS